MSDSVGRDTSIVVLSHNRCDALAANLPVLLALTKEGWLEIIVVDNASTDGTQALLAKLRQNSDALRIVLNDENLGVAEGRNAGYGLAAGRMIITLDDDTRLSPSVVRAIRFAMMGDDNLRLVACRVRHQRTGEWQNDHGNERCVVANFHGAAYAMRGELLDTVGFLDRGCSYGAEELDYSIRAHAAGWPTVYMPELIADHDCQQQTSAEELRRRRLWVYNHLRVLNKHFPASLSLPFSARYTVVHAVRALSFGPRASLSICVAALRGVREGCRTCRPVPDATLCFYKNPSLRPEYGNVPLHNKLRLS